MADRALVQLTIAGEVATVVLDAPASRNALSQAVLAALQAQLDAALAHPGLRVVVLGHTGPAFCAGADLVEQRRTGGLGVAGLVPVLRTIWEAPVPVVARIGGAVRGGGMGLVAACDLAVAADTASFGFSEVRLGVAPAVVSVICRHKLGVAALAEAFLTGRPLDAARARAIGLIHRTVPGSELDREVAELVADLRRGGPGALAATKRILNHQPDRALETALDRMGDRSVELFRSPEAQEGMAAFMQRRPPSWVHEP
ncbi:MAG TPA: enoyl-CoA hydratase-related protein [Verrucomicrobiae bacterium]|nr:enoyl-CoA hydratase-related protein [Verrucomicrobiae bacterium]